MVIFKLNPFKKGQEVVAKEDVVIRRGDQVVALASRGRRMKILKVSGKWVGLSLKTWGGANRGWVYIDSITAASESNSTQPIVTRRCSSDWPMERAEGQLGDGTKLKGAFSDTGR